MSNRRSMPRMKRPAVSLLLLAPLAACSAEAGQADREGALHASMVGDAHDASPADASGDASRVTVVREVREVTGDEASALASVPVADRDACHEAWTRLEASRAAADLRGDPYAVLAETRDAVGWALHSDAAGHAVDIVPSAFEEIAVECAATAGARDACSPLTCHVPLAWQGLDVALSVAVDPVLKRNRQVVGSGQRRSGSDSVGGIQVRYAPVSPEDPFDVLVAWFLDKPRLDDASLAAMRAALHLPGAQPLVFVPLVDQATVAGGQSVFAIQMSAHDDASDVPYWGIFGDRLRATYAARGIDNSLLRFGPVSHAATPARAAAIAKPVALYALTPWAPRSTSPVACGGITENDPARRCDGILESQVGALVDATLQHEHDLFARVVWQEATYGGVYVTTVRVTPEGDATATSTRQVTDLEGLGLPAVDVLAGL
jgi:hypothetical protein